MAQRVPARLSPAEGRRFGLSVGGAFLALGGLLGWRGHAAAGALAAALGATLIAAGVLAPGRLGPAYRAWMGLAVTLSKVTTPLVMGALYFGVVTPVALLRRALGGNPLAHGQGKASCWASRTGARGGPSDMERQF